MKLLLEAIQTKWLATSAITMVITGGLHIDYVPEGVDYPAAVVRVQGVDTEQFYGSGKLVSQVRIEFTVFARSAADAMTDAGLIVTAFDDLSATMTGAVLNDFRRTGGVAVSRTPDDESVERDDVSAPVYGATISYTVVVDQT